jgi:hypothetical protein
MVGNGTTAKAQSYLSSWPCVGSPMSIIPNLICWICSIGSPSTFLRKMLNLSLAERRAISAEGAEGWLRAVLGSGASLLADAPLATREGQP